METQSKSTALVFDCMALTLPRAAKNVGIRMVALDGPDDGVIGMVCINDAAKETVLVVSEKGYGKRSDIEEYRITNRGGKGVKTINITDRRVPITSVVN